MKRPWRLLAVAAVLAMAGWVVFVQVLKPIDETLADAATWQPATTCQVFDSSGSAIDRFYVERRVWISIDTLPDITWQALLAAEDRRFMEHPGVDFLGILRALVVNIQAGGIEEGGSTLTQQLAKNLVVGSERSYQRKSHEALVAWRMERLLSKREILELYLNYVYFGSGNYGLEAAAQDYFGVSAAELDPGQAAMLAGLIPAPSRYSPRRSPELARERRRLVLRAMVEEGYLSQEDADTHNAAPIDPPTRGGYQSAVGAAYLTAVRREVRRVLGTDAAFSSGGLQVHTPFDPAIQAVAEQAVLDAVQGVYARQKREDGVDGAAVVIDNQTGEVVAMVGGTGATLEGFNKATQGRRQPGSSFKPYVYAAALMEGQTQLSTVVDAPLALPGGNGSTWRPQNYSGGFSGAMPMHRALARSLNTVAVRLIMDTGPAAVVSVASSLGVSAEIREDLTIALGSSEVSVLDQAAAYSSLARMGVAIPPTFIRSLQSHTGERLASAGDSVALDGGPVVFLPGGRGRQVIPPAVAYQVVDMLRGVVTSGTARRARAEGEDRAGKTGTTNDFVDAWFVGMVPRYTVAVWIGADNRVEGLGQSETGGRAALPAWKQIVEALPQEPGERFAVPDDVVFVSQSGRWVGIPRARADRHLSRPALDAAPLPDFPGG